VENHSRDSVVIPFLLDLAGVIVLSEICLRSGFVGRTMSADNTVKVENFLNDMIEEDGEGSIQRRKTFYFLRDSMGAIVTCWGLISPI
jgi:hypothetical protein